MIDRSEAGVAMPLVPEPLLFRRVTGFDPQPRKMITRIVSYDDQEFTFPVIIVENSCIFIQFPALSLCEINRLETFRGEWFQRGMQFAYQKQNLQFLFCNLPFNTTTLFASHLLSDSREAR